MTHMPPEDTSAVATETLGANLRRLRLRLGLTQTQLGRVLGVSMQQVQKYEHGDSRIPADHLLHLVEHFGISPTYFFETTTVDTPNLETLIAAYQKLTPRNKRLVSELVHALQPHDGGDG